MQTVFFSSPRSRHVCTKPFYLNGMLPVPYFLLLPIMATSSINSMLSKTLLDTPIRIVSWKNSRIWKVSRIRYNSRIWKNSKIWKNSRIWKDSRILKDSRIWKYSRIWKNSKNLMTCRTEDKDLKEHKDLKELKDLNDLLNKAVRQQYSLNDTTEFQWSQPAWLSPSSLWIFIFCPPPVGSSLPLSSWSSPLFLYIKWSSYADP